MGLSCQGWDVGGVIFLLIVVWAVVDWEGLVKVGIFGAVAFPVLWALFQGPERFPGLWLIIGIILICLLLYEWKSILNAIIPDYVGAKEDLEEANRKLDEANRKLDEANRKLDEANRKLEEMDDSSEDYYDY